MGKKGNFIIKCVPGQYLEIVKENNCFGFDNEIQHLLDKIWTMIYYEDKMLIFDFQLLCRFCMGPVDEYGITVDNNWDDCYVCRKSSSFELD